MGVVSSHIFGVMPFFAMLLMISICESTVPRKKIVRVRPICEHRCTPEGGVLGLFNRVGQFFGQPAAYFTCAKAEMEVGGGSCVNGWNRPDREDLRCCDGSCTGGSENDDFVQSFRLAMQKEQEQENEGDETFVYAVKANTEESVQCGQGDAAIEVKSFEECANVKLFETATDSSPDQSMGEEDESHTGARTEGLDQLADTAHGEARKDDLTRHVVPYRGRVEVDEKSYLTFDDTPEGSLHDLLLRAKRCAALRGNGIECSKDTLEALNFARTCADAWLSQIVDGIENLVSMRYIHRNLKFENIMIRRNEKEGDLCKSRRLLFSNFRGAVQIKDDVKIYFPVETSEQPAGITESMLSYRMVEAKSAAVLPAAASGEDLLRGEASVSRGNKRHNGRSAHVNTPLLAKDTYLDYVMDCRYMPPTQQTFMPIHFTDMFAFGALLRELVDPEEFGMYAGVFPADQLTANTAVQVLRNIVRSIIPPSCQYMTLRGQSKTTPCGTSKQWFCDEDSWTNTVDTVEKGLKARMRTKDHGWVMFDDEDVKGVDVDPHLNVYLKTPRMQGRTLSPGGKGRKRESGAFDFDGLRQELQDAFKMSPWPRMEEQKGASNRALPGSCVPCGRSVLVEDCLGV